jgi:hypothetical protein
MAKDIFWITTTFVIMISVLLLAFWPADKSTVVVVKYDCEMLMGGWHPDVPIAVQEECRKLRSKK